MVLARCFARALAGCEEFAASEVDGLCEPGAREEQVEDGSRLFGGVCDASVHGALVVDEDVADGEFRSKDGRRLFARAAASGFACVRA